MTNPLTRTLLITTLTTAALLYLLPPETYSFYPQCPIHQLTGLLCPGCGATRALAALLHGHLYQALKLNGLLPIAGLYLLTRHQLNPQWNRIALAAVYVATATFTIARNLPAR